jgi:hypothetical protein
MEDKTESYCSHKSDKSAAGVWHNEELAISLVNTNAKNNIVFV